MTQQTASTHPTGMLSCDKYIAVAIAPCKQHFDGVAIPYNNHLTFSIQFVLFRTFYC